MNPAREEPLFHSVGEKHRGEATCLRPECVWLNYVFAVHLHLGHMGPLERVAHFTLPIYSTTAT